MRRVVLDGVVFDTLFVLRLKKVAAKRIVIGDKWVVSFSLAETEPFKSVVWEVDSDSRYF